MSLIELLNELLEKIGDRKGIWLPKDVAIKIRDILFEYEQMKDDRKESV